MRDQSLSIHEHIAADLIVDTPHDLVGLFDERCLVLANRYDGRLERGDVGRLGNRVTEEPQGYLGRIVTQFEISAGCRAL